MSRFACPRCATVVAASPGSSLTCPGCGYSAAVPTGPAAQPAPPVAAWPQPGAYGPPGPYGPPPGYPAPQPPGQTLVTVAWVLGPLGLLSPLIGIAGIVCAAIARSQGHPKATAPLIVAICCSSAIVVVMLLVFGMMAVA